MLDNAWKDEGIPQAQWDVAGPELDRIRRGEWEKVAPFNVMREVFGKIVPYCKPKPSVLDIGAAAGYYREVLKIAGYDFDYMGLDYSPAFEKFAKEKFPDIQYMTGDATALPVPNGSYDVVLHGACIMHVTNWQKAIEEAYRVAKKFVIFHRTPILWKEPTLTFRKLAYHVECEERHFNYDEFEGAIERAGGMIISMYPIFEQDYEDGTKKYGHYTFLTVKQPNE